MVQVQLGDIPVHDTVMLESGLQTSTSIRRKLIAEKLLYENSTLMAIGTQLLDNVMTDDLEFRFAIPGEVEYHYDVPEGQGPVEREHVEHVHLGGRIKKGYISWGQTIEAGIRGNTKYQNAITQRQAELALATEIDAHILDAIQAGAGASAVTVDTNEKWDGEGLNSPNIIGNVTKAYNNILSESNVAISEMKKLSMIIPSGVYGNVISVSEINNLVQSLEKYFKASLGLTVYPTRDADFANAAYLMVPGKGTGFFARLNPAAIRAAGHQSTWLEQKVGIGWLYTSINFWGAFIQPYPNTGSTTTRICKIDKILTD